MRPKFQNKANLLTFSELLKEAPTDQKIILWAAYNLKHFKCQDHSSSYALGFYDS